MTEGWKSERKTPNCIVALMSGIKIVQQNWKAERFTWVRSGKRKKGRDAQDQSRSCWRRLLGSRFGRAPCPQSVPPPRFRRPCTCWPFSPSIAVPGSDGKHVYLSGGTGGAHLTTIPHVRSYSRSEVLLAVLARLNHYQSVAAILQDSKAVLTLTIYRSGERLKSD